MGGGESWIRRMTLIDMGGGEGGRGKGERMEGRKREREGGRRGDGKEKGKEREDRKPFVKKHHQEFEKETKFPHVQ